MKFTLKWLREHLDFNCSLDYLIENLTSLGLEVEKVNNPYVFLKDFKICQIKKTLKHPNADKLKICKVFDGKKFLEIVCGAENAKENLITVLAPVGVTLPLNDKKEKIKIKESNIRDIRSYGMLCSANELGLGSESDGIIELKVSQDKVGKSFAEIEDEENIVIEISITPNRPDCAGVSGIARDLAAKGVGKLKEKNVIKIEKTFESEIKLKNELEISDCPQFSLRVIKNVRNNSSPNYLQKRFNRSGIKVISALVDVTNYLTFDFCRPLHAFDFDKISGEIVIRHSKLGEKFEALDGITYKLEDEMIVICDSVGIISLAGVMGGKRTACDLNTKNVLLESAYFKPEKISSTGRKLMIDSDARYRFERGIDPNSTISGLEIATKMILDFCGGDPGSIISKGKCNEIGNEVVINKLDVKQILGIEISDEYIKTKLEALGFNLKSKKNDLVFLSPSWRNDIKIKEDLIEEIARIFGYENIPSKPIINTPKFKKNITNQNQKFKRMIRRRLVSNGLAELITWSFVDSKYEKLFNKDKIIKISNPISSELNSLRSTLAVNLIIAIKKNQKRGYFNRGFFEIGPVFFGSKPFEQKDCIFGIRSGEISSKDWFDKPRKFDLFDVKSDLFDILDILNFSSDSICIDKNNLPLFLHPKKSASISIGKKSVGYFGYIHPDFLKSFELKQDLICFNICLSDILGFIKNIKISKPAYFPSQFQSSKRDFSFVVKKDLYSVEIVNLIKKLDKDLIKNVRVFDQFVGDELDKDKKALAIEVTIQSEEKTLTELDLENLSKLIVNNIKDTFNAELRK